MRQKNDYLSDEELDCLIAEVEQSELIPAPPDLAEQILDTAGKIKVREFRRYCIRVWTSVAAAVVLTFLLPGAMNLWQVQSEQLNLSWNEKAAFTESRWIQNEGRWIQNENRWIQSESGRDRRFETKEEALNETGLWEQLLGGYNFFERKDRFGQSDEGKEGNGL